MALTKCALCGKEIPKNRRATCTKYCSRLCSRKAENARRIKHITKRAAAHNKIGAYINFIYKSKCAICGWQALNRDVTPQGKAYPARGNEIHHIIPVREGGKDEESNLIMLCPNHHKQADLGVIDRDTLRCYVKAFNLEEAEATKTKAKADCADAIIGLIS